MYVNPFLAGVLCTICLELVVVFATVIYSYIKHKDEREDK